MKTLGWPPNFVARCPVRLFEASGGSNSWQPSGAVGELHMRPLDNSMLHFQIHDLLDNQVLFEHTMRKPDAFIVSSERFFVIRLENGSFRGFGFTEKAAASEMKDRVQKAVKPFIITEPCLPSILATDEPQTSVLPSQPPVEGSSDNKSSELVLYESVPRRSSLKGTSQHVKEQSSPSMQPLEEEANLTPESKLHKLRSRWKLVLKGLVALTQIFGFRDHELEIGYPTDVKHVAHIGWDGPSIGGLSWMDELKPAPDFSTAPLREFGQPRGPDWIYDALAAAKWTSQGNSESSKLPPAPPPEFLDQTVEQVGQPSRQKDPSSRRKSKPSLRRQQIYQI